MKDQGRFLKKYRGNECLNCGVPLDVLDRYCHNCGQLNTTKRLSLKDFFDEFFASIFSYDSRLRHTMMALLFKPGKISKDYNENDLKEYMKWDSINIEINLNIGSAFYTVYTCDFTHDYININADYRN